MSIIKFTVIMGFAGVIVVLGLLIFFIFLVANDNRQFPVIERGQPVEQDFRDAGYEVETTKDGVRYWRKVNEEN